MEFSQSPLSLISISVHRYTLCTGNANNGAGESLEWYQQLNGCIVICLIKYSLDNCCFLSCFWYICVILCSLCDFCCLICCCCVRIMCHDYVLKQSKTCWLLSPSGNFCLTCIKISTMESIAGTMSFALGDQSMIFTPNSMWGTYMWLVGILCSHRLHIDFSL